MSCFSGKIPSTRWGILDDDGGYFYCITYNSCRMPHSLKRRPWPWCPSISEGKSSRQRSGSMSMPRISPSPVCIRLACSPLGMRRRARAHFSSKCTTARKCRWPTAMTSFKRKSCNPWSTWAWLRVRTSRSSTCNM